MRIATRAGLCIAASWFGTACGGVTEDITLEFPSDALARRTRSLAVSVFEPIVTSPDGDTQFVDCQNISVFPPLADVDPEGLDARANLGEVLKVREDVPFAAGEGVDWNVSFPRLSGKTAGNPWGVVAIYVEARGEARTAQRPTRRVTATLAAGCYCLRTQEGSALDPALDQRVKATCDLVDTAQDSTEQRVLALTSVAPPQFKLSRCEGTDQVTAPRNAELSPGPAVCLSAVRCDDQQGNRDCFECDQPCDELTNLSKAPILLSIDPPRQTGSTDDDGQVVLTGEDGRATASLPIFDCQQDLTIRATVLGGAQAPVDFSVTCVNEPESFACSQEDQLVPGASAVDMTYIPISSLGDCSQTNPAGCDRVVVMTSTGANRAVVELRHPNVTVAPEILTFADERPHAVHGFLYDAVQKSRPALAVVTANLRGREEALLRVYEWIEGRLTLIHGPGELLSAGRCARWRCGSEDPCGPGQSCTLPGEICQEASGQCIEGEPCDLVLAFQASVSIDDRRLDDDDYADLVIGSSTELPMAFFYTEGAGPEQLYAVGECECARFGQSPKSFAFVTLGGSANPGRSSDMVFGSEGGTFVKYTSSVRGRKTVACGDLISLKDGKSVRDVARARFRCAGASSECLAFEDAVVLSAQGISGGSLDEPGFIRVLYGSAVDLGVPAEPLSEPDTHLVLRPRVFAQRDEPRDPRSIRIGDFNRDGYQDLAVLYRTSEEVHLWYGSGRGGLGEGARGVILSNCPTALNPLDERCPASAFFATPDQDGDGASEVVVACRLSEANTLRYFTPILP